MPILNYTTTVAVARSVSEMQTMLAKAGADTISIRYDDGKPVGLSFRLMTLYGWRHFALPVNAQPIWKVLSKQRVDARFRKIEHAERVAWRIAKDWLEAQLAIVESQMVSFDQVMLPYMHVDGSKTLYEAYEERETALALTTGTEG